MTISSVKRIPPVKFWLFCFTFVLVETFFGGDPFGGARLTDRREPRKGSFTGLRLPCRTEQAAIKFMLIPSTICCIFKLDPQVLGVALPGLASPESSLEPQLFVAWPWHGPRWGASGSSSDRSPGSQSCRSLSTRWGCLRLESGWWIWNRVEKQRKTLGFSIRLYWIVSWGVGKSQHFLTPEVLEKGALSCCGHEWPNVVPRAVVVIPRQGTGELVRERFWSVNPTILGALRLDHSSLCLRIFIKYHFPELRWS